MRHSRSSMRKDRYYVQTQRPLNSLVFILPLLAIYHIGAYYYQDRRLLVPQYVDWILVYFGAPRAVLAPLVILGVLFLQHLVRRDPWKLHGWALAGTLAESLASVLPLIFLARLTGRAAGMFAQLTQPASFQLPPQMVLAIGAGIYEEFLFRLAYIALFMVLLVDVVGLKKEVTEVLAVLSGAVIFALCHFSWQQIGGDQAFDWARFLFLMLAGMAWGTLFLARGFGVAAGSHVFWDIYATWVSA